MESFTLEQTVFLILLLFYVFMIFITYGRLMHAINYRSTTKEINLDEWKKNRNMCVLLSVIAPLVLNVIFIISKRRYSKTSLKLFRHSGDKLNYQEVDDSCINTLWNPLNKESLQTIIKKNWNSI